MVCDMDNHGTNKVVTLKDLWNLFLQRLWVMAVVAVIAVAGFGIVKMMTYEPLYESTATLYILRQSNEPTTSGDASSDFSLALKVVNDCTYLLKSHTVLDQVIHDLGLDMDYETLYKCVSTYNPSDTRILEVSVKAENSDESKRIVDKICQIGQQSITDAMGFEQVNLFAYGTLEKEPCNTTSILVYLIIAVAAAILTYSVFLVIFLLDDRFRTSDDIERHLHLSILGEIPDAKDASNKHYGYYSAYGRDEKKPSRKR